MGVVQTEMVSPCQASKARSDGSIPGYLRSPHPGQVSWPPPDSRERTFLVHRLQPIPRTYYPVQIGASLSCIRGAVATDRDPRLVEPIPLLGWRGLPPLACAR